MGFLGRHDAMLYRWRVDGQQLDNYCAQAMLALKRNRQHQYQPALDPDCWSVSGHRLNARYVFCTVNSDRHWPFYRRETPTTVALVRALQDCGFNETLAMWTTVGSPDGVNHLANLVDDGLVPIAVGVEAYRACQQLGKIERFHCVPDGAEWSRWEYRDAVERLMENL